MRLHPLVEHIQDLCWLYSLMMTCHGQSNVSIHLNRLKAVYAYGYPCLDDRDTITRVLDSSRTSSHVDDHICSVSFSFKGDGGG